jgi:hypothetical protein
MGGVFENFDAKNGGGLRKFRREKGGSSKISTRKKGGVFYFWTHIMPKFWGQKHKYAVSGQGHLVPNYPPMSPKVTQGHSSKVILEVTQIWNCHVAQRSWELFAIAQMGSTIRYHVFWPTYVRSRRHYRRKHTLALTPIGKVRQL